MYRNWETLIKPKSMEIEEETLSPTYGRFHVEPLERGLGITIGNSLRRILLSSLQGAAVCAVRIKGVLHEFSTIYGVREDVTDIILNLKQIFFKVNTQQPKTLTIKATGPCEIKAKDIQIDGDVQILNPESHIATISENGSLQMEMRLKYGRGYVAAEKNFEEDLVVGYIPIDSVHSPVRKVKYEVEMARLGQTTDYEKLIMDIWTNGSITAADAVSLAAKLLKDHLTIFMNFEEEPVADMQADEKRIEKIGDLLSKRVDEMELSVRSYNCLKNANIQTVGELAQKSELEMLQTKNFGRKSLAEIKEILVTMGLSFGMRIEGGVAHKVDMPMEHAPVLNEDDIIDEDESE